MNTAVVLITGALTGIGRATALAFAKEGANIVVSGRRDEAGHALADELSAHGAQAEFVRADVHGHAGPLHRQFGEKSTLRRRGADEPPGKPRKNRRRHRLSGMG